MIQKKNRLAVLSTANGRKAFVLWGENGMYSDYLVEVIMDYPVRVATKLKFGIHYEFQVSPVQLAI